MPDIRMPDGQVVRFPDAMSDAHIRSLITSKYPNEVGALENPSPDLPRIKNNVRKMAAQNAPEADVDGYIASEGVTIDDVRNFKDRQPIEVELPDGSIAEFPAGTPRDTMRDAVRRKVGSISHSEAMRGNFSAAQPVEANAGPTHYAFDGSSIPGYNPETGTVDNERLSMPRTTSTLFGAIEGLPIAGPFARQGVEATAAAIGSGLSGEPFDKVRSQMSGMVDGAAVQHPNFNMAGKVGGAVAGTIPMVMAAPYAFGASAGPLAARMAASAVTGGALGGADAGVRGGLEAVPSGAAWGAGLGLAAPAVGQAVGAGTRALVDRFVSGATKAEQALGRAAGADAIDDIGGRLASMGPDAMPMDLGPNLLRQAGALAASPGKGQRIVRNAITTRQAGSGGRVAGALDDALGQPVDTVSLADDIIAKRSAAAKPLYDAAYSKPIPFTTELETLLGRPSVARALSKAKGLAADEGIPSQQWFANIADDGTVSMRRVPDVRQLDLTKRALDDMISTAQRGGNNNEARILTQTKNALLKLMDDAAPEYAAARKAYSGPTAIVDALEEGQKAFANNLTPNQLRTQLLKMGDGEKEAFIQGARAKVASIMGTARNDALAARSTFQTGYNKEKLEILIGKEQAAKMLQSLDSETAFTRTRDVVTGNSETAARVSAQQDIGAGVKQPGLIRSAFNMRFGDVAAELGDKVVGGARNAVQQRANEELARLLTSRDPTSITRAIKMVQAAQKRGDITAQRAKEIIQGATVGGSQRRQPLEVTVGRN